MAILIDGYNLLHASGILARGIGPSTLQRTRGALLDFLAESLEPRELARTTVVFDAGTSASGRVRGSEHRGIAVRFSAAKADADDLIEELIRADSAPRRLVVVSSDHRIQRAAHRRKARAVDSDRWFSEVLRARSERQRAADRGAGAAEAPAGAGRGRLEAHEVLFWLKRFGFPESLMENSAKPDAGAGENPRAESAEPDSAHGSRRATELSRFLDDAGDEKSDAINLGNPFPPGYGEDVTLDDDPPAR